MKSTEGRRTLIGTHKAPQAAKCLHGRSASSGQRRPSHLSNLSRAYQCQQSGKDEMAADFANERVTDFAFAPALSGKSCRPTVRVWLPFFWAALLTALRAKP